MLLRLSDLVLERDLRFIGTGLGKADLPFIGGCLSDILVGEVLGGGAPGPTGFLADGCAPGGLPAGCLATTGRPAVGLEPGGRPWDGA